MSITVPSTNSQGHASEFGIRRTANTALAVAFNTLINGTIWLSAMPAYASNIEAVWRGTQDLDRWIQNVATSMTNVIRTDKPLSRDEFNGTAYHLAYVVRWRWITLPATMVFSSILFWVVIMVQTARSPVQAWKGSPLTLLLFGVDEEAKWEVDAAVDEYQGIEKAIAKRKIVLTKQPSGMRKFELI